MPHEFLEVAEGRLDQEMKMVFHENVGQNFNLIDFPRLVQERKEGCSVSVTGKDFLPGIAPASHMIIRTRKLNPQRPRHNTRFYLKSSLLSRIKI
jgi:hypothetical protein